MEKENYKNKGTDDYKETTIYRVEKNIWCGHVQRMANKHKNRKVKNNLDRSYV